MPCPTCGADLETPLGCHACGVLLQPDETPTPFAAFGLEPAWGVDKKDLKRRLLSCTRLCHPDHHATSPPAVKRLAEEHSALLNHAYEVLLDDFLRADWLTLHLGGPRESEERQMPQAFLMEVLEWNEALEDAERSSAGSPERAALEGLGVTLHREHERQLAGVGAALEPLPERGAPELAGVRRQLNAVRYLSRTLYKIRDLRFAEVPAPTDH